MIVKDSQVEAAVAVIADAERGVEVRYEARKAEFQLDRARHRAYLAQNSGTISEREARVGLTIEVMDFEDALNIAVAEVDRWKADLHKAETIVELYRTESANLRRGNL